MSASGPVRKAEITKEDWETPDPIFRWIESLRGTFTLDLAADEFNHKCPIWVGPGSSICEDAFDLFNNNVIYNHNIWCNPPYGKLEKWIELFIHLSQSNNIVALVPNATETRWFYSAYESERLDLINLLKGRIPFVGTTSSNTTGSALLFWDRNRLSTGDPIVRIVDWKNELRKYSSFDGLR